MSRNYLGKRHFNSGNSLSEKHSAKKLHDIFKATMNSSLMLLEANNTKMGWVGGQDVKRQEVKSLEDFNLTQKTRWTSEEMIKKMTLSPDYSGSSTE